MTQSPRITHHPAGRGATRRANFILGRAFAVAEHLRSGARILLYPQDFDLLLQAGQPTINHPVTGVHFFVSYQEAL